ncbi:hypothetical protein F4801DRAFT_558463 [Xylaria longipes]|nr:hypothetical protein F4801DRAFT_558463 [Xylaria longipes]RYC56406.1 hypothetical protein CHU98_g9797 [Xylaria longipes]
MAGQKKAKKNSKKTKKQSRAPSQSQPSNAQEGSQLFRIPQEVRDLIYAQLFFDTRLSHGRRSVGRISDLRIVSASNSLAMLTSCRRARAEIGDSWLGWVLFSFEDTETMMTKLAALPIATLSKVHHIRVRGETLMLSWPDGDVHYRLVHALKLLPGLQLDTLTVLNLYGGKVSYDVLNTLIKYGQGWKELRFISHASSLLGFAADDEINDRYWRKPQPADWIRAMNNRDGAASQPSVTIYRSTLAGQSCTVSDEASRVRFEQKPTKPHEEVTFATQEYGDLMSPGEKTKELMVVVRRGRGIDYQEKPGSPFLTAIGDIRKDCPGMTWLEIKKQHIDFPSDSEDDDSEFSDSVFGDRDPIKQDIYKHADDYEWTPLNFDSDA